MYLESLNWDYFADVETVWHTTMHSLEISPLGCLHNSDSGASRSLSNVYFAAGAFCESNSII